VWDLEKKRCVGVLQSRPSIDITRVEAAATARGLFGHAPNGALLAVGAAPGRLGPRAALEQSSDAVLCRGRLPDGRHGIESGQWRFPHGVGCAGCGVTRREPELYPRFSDSSGE